MGYAVISGETFSKKTYEIPKFIEPVCSQLGT